MALTARTCVLARRFSISARLLPTANLASFSSAVGGGGQVKAVVYPGGADLTRREIDELTDFVKHYGAKGLAWIGVTGEPDADGQSMARMRCAARLPNSSAPKKCARSSRRRAPSLAI